MKRDVKGELSLFAKGRVGKGWLSYKFNVEKEIVKFKPLIDMNFGNIIPIKPLQINLFSLGEAVKMVEKSVDEVM